MASLGILKETKVAERRVAVVPADVALLRDAGADVLVETGAGDGAGFADGAYVRAGAQVAASARQVLSSCDVVLKVKEPTLPEIEQLRPGQLFMSFLHLAASPDLIPPLKRSGATALGYETITEGGQHPVLRPMSEVAGSLALQIGEHYLEATSGGRGVLLPGIHGDHSGKVVIVGSGVVGEACGRLAYGEGIQVVFVDANHHRLQQLAACYPQASFCSPEPDRLGRELEDADLLVGAVYVTGARAPQVAARELIARMPLRSVAVDVAIDQGGCFATSRPTTHADPVYVEAGVLHYCVTNIPTMVPRSASLALSRALVPYLLPITRLGVDAALASEPALAGAVNIQGGRIVLPALQELGMHGANRPAPQDA